MGYLSDSGLDNAILFLMKLLTIIFSFYSFFLVNALAAPSGEREWRIVIENDYKRDKKIWGTYGQTSEKTSLYKKKKRIAEKRNPAANMMLKNGKMVLIQPVTKMGVTTYKVKQFPYKKSKGRRYQVQLAKQKDGFLEIYKVQLLAILKKNKINPNAIDWDSLEVEKMNCKSRKRSFNCKIPLVIKSKPNS